MTTALDQRTRDAAMLSLARTMPLSQIARAYGVSLSVVRRCLRRTRRQNVPTGLRPAALKGDEAHTPNRQATAPLAGGEQGTRETA